MRLDSIRSARAFAFVLGTSFLWPVAPALAETDGKTGGATIGETDRNRELDTDRERQEQRARDQQRARDGSTLGGTRGTQPDPSGATGRDDTTRTPDTTGSDRGMGGGATGGGNGGMNGGGTSGPGGMGGGGTGGAGGMGGGGTGGAGGP